MAVEFSDSTLVKINPGTDPAVISLKEEIAGLLKYAETRVIAGDADVRSATEDLGLLARLKKAIADKRKDWLTPIKEKLDAVDLVFKGLSLPLDQADKVTRTKILAYRADQERKAREAEEINRQKQELAKREAAFNGTGEITIDTTPVAVPAAPPAHVRTDVGTLGTAKIWKFEVVDFKALPEEYKIADEVKIGKVVRATKGSLAIAGVRIWSEDSLRVTT